MGKIFSTEELQQGKIPVPGAHEAAADYIMERIFTHDPQLPAFSGLIYGSTANGTADMRSDVDLFARVAHAQTLGRILAEAEYEFNVPVETHVVPPWQDRDAHHIEPFLVSHLQRAQENPRWSHKWPVENYQSTDAYTEEQLRTIVWRYCNAKQRQFEQAQVDYRGIPDLHTLQRAFELPVAIGRKLMSFETETLDVHDKPALIGNILLLLASDDAIWDATENDEVTYPMHLTQLLPEPKKPWKRFGRRTHTADALRDLVRMNAVYDGLLADTIASGDIKEYNKWIQAHYMEACGIAADVTNRCAARAIRPIAPLDWNSIKEQVARHQAEDGLY